MTSYEEEGVLAEAPADDLNSLARHNGELQSEIKTLEVQLAKKESEVRRATEEHALRRELLTIQQMSLRKQTYDNIQTGRIRIDSESLATVVALEDQIKLETKKTSELERQAEVCVVRLSDVEQNILNKSHQISLIKDTTGWERDHCAARGYTHPINAYRDHQRVITELEGKQNTVKGVLDKLSNKLETLTAELERRKNIDEELADANLMLKKKQMELAKLQDDKKSLARLLQKKEKMLKDTESKDDYKTVKLLEGEKRVLHNELARNHELTMTNSKSILAQEVRLRQLEMRLQAMNQFLQQVLTVSPEEPLPEGVEPGSDVVAVELFDAIQRELAISRHTVIQRDAQLEAQDAKVEQLEKKVNILHCAIVTRTATAAQEAKEMDNEYNVISVHLDYMRNEFEQEHHKLLMENESLRQKVEDQTGLLA